MSTVESGGTSDASQSSKSDTITESLSVCVVNNTSDDNDRVSASSVENGRHSDYRSVSEGCESDTRCDNEKAGTVCLDQGQQSSTEGGNSDDRSASGHLSVDQDQRSLTHYTEMDKNGSVMSEAVHVDVDIDDTCASDQLSDSDELCQDLASRSIDDVHSYVSISQQVSDDAAIEQSAVEIQRQNANGQLTAAGSVHPNTAISSQPRQLKLDKSVILSTLKNVSENEDEALVYIVSSEYSSQCVSIFL